LAASPLAQVEMEESGRAVRPTPRTAVAAARVRYLFREGWGTGND